jgi:protein-S-isoprenylcysteine O-methyltransferase Ste14
MNFLTKTGTLLFPLRLVIGLGAVVLGAIIIRPDPYLTHSWFFQSISGCIVSFGLFLRAWAAAYAGHHTRSDTIEAPQLVTGGPYAYVRNPIYLGSLILGLGMVCLVGDPKLFFLYALTFLILFFAIIPAEEDFLRRKFSTTYGQYCKNVPRLVPRLSGWMGASQIAPDWHAAKGDLWISLLLFVIFAVMRLIASWKGS